MFRPLQVSRSILSIPTPYLTIALTFLYFFRKSLSIFSFLFSLWCLLFLLFCFVRLFFLCFLFPVFQCFCACVRVRVFLFVFVLWCVCVSVFFRGGGRGGSSRVGSDQWRSSRAKGSRGGVRGRAMTTNRSERLASGSWGGGSKRTVLCA